MNNVYIIGAGGVGSWLTPSLCLLIGPENITVMDGDTLEEKNLNRQLFTEADIGFNKAITLADRYHCFGLSYWFSSSTLMDFSQNTVLMVCADNNPARLAALRVADIIGCQVIIAANETHSAEAYYYRRAWEGGPLDPRVYYPTIVTDHTNNPLAANSGCTGEAQKANPQLVSANFMAAALAQQLFVLWIMEKPKLDSEVVSKLPFHLRSNLSRLEFIRVEDALKGGQDANRSSE